MKTVCSPNRHGQSGFTMMAAVFLIVILALIGAAIVSISTQQSRSISVDMLGARAYQAAKAGIEAGAYNSLRVGATGTCSGQTITFGGTLSGFTAVVTCTRSTHTEGSTTINTDTIVSTACNQTPCPDVSGAPPGTYVERKMTINVENP